MHQKIYLMPELSTRFFGLGTCAFALLGGTLSPFCFRAPDPGVEHFRACAFALFFRLKFGTFAFTISCCRVPNFSRSLFGLSYLCIGPRRGKPGQESQDMTGRTGQAEQDRTGQAEPDRLNRTRKMGQVDQGRQNRTSRLGLAEQERQNETGKTGLGE